MLRLSKPVRRLAKGGSCGQQSCLQEHSEETETKDMLVRLDRHISARSTFKRIVFVQSAIIDRQKCNCFARSS